MNGVALNCLVRRQENRSGRPSVSEAVQPRSKHDRCLHRWCDVVFHHTCRGFLLAVVQGCIGRTASPSRVFSWVKLLSLIELVDRPASSVYGAQCTCAAGPLTGEFEVSGTPAVAPRLLGALISDPGVEYGRPLSTASPDSNSPDHGLAINHQRGNPKRQESSPSPFTSIFLQQTALSPKRQRQP
jgi:hypothetical protein